MQTTRLAVLDLARGLAVVAMAIYHFSWDLSWFGFVDWPVTLGVGWRSFAASIAGSFLFLAGVSLDLAHHKGIRWHAFWRRFAVIVAAAAAISLVTYFAFGNSFVRFGILHSIAAASLIAIPFTRAPLWLTFAASVFVLTLPLWASSYFFNGQFWLWTGLGTPDYGSVDYVPVAPWAGVTLAGLALSEAFRKFNVWEKLSNWSFAGRAGRSTRFIGRHSLVVYLLHQPVLFSLVWTATLLGPDVDRAATAFIRNCSVACQDNLGAPDICNAACSCTIDRLKADDVWTALNDDPTNQSLRAQMNTRYAQCLADPEWNPVTD
ncbi:heparan-alpha-glucosaminide N-acetyltransferase [Roseibium sp. SCP14]|uniref:heparan-alpha-glucosaminide N-acetyltransferase n=1 Tax=Roseibium sp. SCP14 TaxID=3141375 RepID=UPI00333B3712